MSKLNEALQYAQKWSTRSPARSVNSCAVAVQNRTIQLTPFVSIERIDTELATQVYYAKTKTGRESTAKRNRRFSGGISAIQRVQNIPLAVLIIQARAASNSNYNIKTNFRYAGPSPFKGVSRSEGAQLMKAAMHRMIATRHSSSKFLISGWVESRRQMRRAVFGEPPTFDADTGQLIEHDLGRSIPARENTLVAVCVIENLVGLGDSKNARNYNNALIEHGTGPLQQAIDEEAAQKFDYIANKLFALELAPNWRRLTA